MRGIPTKLDVPSDRVLAKAIEAGVDPVLVLGYNKDGELYAASSSGERGTILELMELFKHRLMAGDFK